MKEVRVVKARTLYVSSLSLRLDMRSASRLLQELGQIQEGWRAVCGRNTVGTYLCTHIIAPCNILLAYVFAKMLWTP